LVAASPPKVDLFWLIGRFCIEVFAGFIGFEEEDVFSILGGLEFANLLI